MKKEDIEPFLKIYNEQQESRKDFKKFLKDRSITEKEFYIRVDEIRKELIEKENQLIDWIKKNNFHIKKEEKEDILEDKAEGKNADRS